MFMERFAPLILSGAKRQTIRPIPKTMPEVGDKESWRKWSSRPYNSPQIELAQVELIGVFPITILITSHRSRVVIDGCIQTDLEGFAQKDGFDSYEDFLAFFFRRYESPFNGILIAAK